MDAQKTKSALTLGILVFAVSAIVAWFNPLQVIQWRISDLFFAGRGPSDSITIVAIDETSIGPDSGLGRFKDWPRSYYSQLLRAIGSKKPALVAFDLDFRESSRGISSLRLQQLLREYERVSGEGGNLNWPALLKKFEDPKEHPDDKDFQKAIDENPVPIVLTSTLTFEGQSAKSVIAPIFGGPNVTIGYKNVMRDRDGVLRRFTPETKRPDGQILKSFAAAIAEKYKGQEIGDDEKAGEQILIGYAAKPFSFPRISFVDLLAGNYDASEIEGKIVIVGATANILQDFHPTPTSRDFMPGVEINANLTQQLIEGFSASEQGNFSLFVLLIILSIVGSFILLIIPIRYFIWIFSVVLLALPVAAYGFYQTGFVMNVIYPEITWIFAGIAVLIYRNKTELRANREIKRAFAHYVSPIVVNELVKDPAALKLGGKREQISVLFSDIVGFTSFAEKLSPEDTVAVLNDYLTAMTEVVFGYNGTLDKYQGDAIMALFGAPLMDEHHAVNACHAALGMRRALTSLHEKWNLLPEFPLKEDLIRLDFRVGIATGPAVVGNVGSEKRFDYTAIGDIVNLGSRLEGVNKKYGTHVIVDKNTFTTVTENHNPFVFRKLDTVRVKGKAHETEIFEVYSLAENVTSDARVMLDDFENGRILYTQRNFAEAKQYFDSALEKVPGDGPSSIYVNRCKFFLRKPPSLDWSPVVNLEEK